MRMPVHCELVGQTQHQRVSRSTLVRKFGRENRLGIFHLRQPSQRTDTTPVRHTFGFGCNDSSLRKNLLPFFHLLPRFTTVPATHNRVL
jgi:hypothetical protein